MTIFRLSFNDEHFGLWDVDLTPENGFEVLDLQKKGNGSIITLLLLGSNYSENLEYLGKLEWLRERVEDFRNNNEFQRTFLERDLTDSQEYFWRTPLNSFQIELDRSFYDLLNGRKPQLDLILEHPEYWESEEVDLPVFNGHLSEPTTDPVLVDNTNGYQGALRGACYDYLMYQYSENTDNFNSMLPFPLKISINSGDGNPDIDRIFICPTNSLSENVHNWDAYMASGGTLLPASPNYSLYQTGRYREAIIGTSWSELIQWNINASYLDYQSYLVLTRILNPNSNKRIGIRFGYNGSILSEWLQDFSDEQEISKAGFLRTGIIDTNLDYAMSYQLSLMGISDSEETLEIDYIELYPAQDFVELVSATGKSLEEGQTLVIDGAIQKAYVIDSGGGIIDRWIIRGKGNLTLNPQMDGIIYFKCCGEDTINLTNNVIIQARQRSRI